MANTKMGKKLVFGILFIGRMILMNLNSCNIISYSNLLGVADLMIMELRLGSGLNYRMDLVAILQ